MEFINLTPHPIKVKTKDGEMKTFEPSGSVARVNVQETPAGDLDGITLLKRTTGEAQGIPEKKDDTVYIVSSMVLSATNRSDVVAPNTGKSAIRDDQGRIQGVTEFVTNGTSKMASFSSFEKFDWVGRSIL